MNPGRELEGSLCVETWGGARAGRAHGGQSSGISNLSVLLRGAELALPTKAENVLG